VAKVTMPQLGESVAEGTIGKWLKQPGDHVAKYEPLLEVITDKVNAEVPSPFEGILKEILVEEGATVPNNAEIAVIEEAGAAASPTPAKEAAPAASTATSTAAASNGSASVAPASKAAAESAPPAEAAAPAAQATAPEAAAAHASAAAASPMASSAAPTAHGPAGSDERGPADLPGNADARMTPAVRRLLREHGLSAAMISGTGGGGRITREDVTDYVESQRTGQPVGRQNAGAAAAAPSTAAPSAASTPSPAPVASAPTSASRGPAPATQASAEIAFPEGADEVLVPMTQMRKGIAAQMTRALQVPHAYVQMEVDVSSLVRLRDKQKRDYQAREGISLSFVPFVVKASAEALKRNPTFNAHWTENGLLAKRRVNIGIAVAVEGGLIVPVIRDVDHLSINGINKAIAEVSDRARANKLRIDDFGGGTFTVDNTGWLGTNMVMPIINVPEVGIVTMDRITKRPVVIETPDGDVIGIRPVMNMVLGVDHRANDGAGGAALLRDIKAWLEAVGPDTAIY
jgi:pyruvate/2-oxoglutarate dehydrogenase complex dihydrolipoamide acyltransferase (E2) component